MIPRDLVNSDFVSVIATATKNKELKWHLAAPPSPANQSFRTITPVKDTCWTTSYKDLAVSVYKGKYESWLQVSEPSTTDRITLHEASDRVGPVADLFKLIASVNQTAVPSL